MLLFLPTGPCATSPAHVLPAVTQQLFFQSRSRPHSAHPGTGGRMVTSWADAAAEADADAERVAIQRQLLRVAGPIDLQSAEHKQIADTAVWAAEEGKMRGTMVRVCCPPPGTRWRLSDVFCQAPR